MTYECLEVVEEGSLILATLNRPERLNALNWTLVRELRDFFGQLYWRTDARVVILRGAGTAFCAGLDLKEMGAQASDVGVVEALQQQREISQIVIDMRRCPQPIIALVDGPASGGGFALALAADVRIGTPSLRMNAAFIRVGLSACDIGVSYFLPRMIGSSLAAEYMLTGRFIDAERSVASGLVSRIVPPEALEAAGREIADEMLLATSLGLRLTKEALNVSIDAQGLEAVIALEDRNQILAARGEDFQEGVNAFLEKRKPRYV